MDRPPHGAPHGAARVDAQAARRGLQQGGVYVRRLFKLLVIRAYLLDLMPARVVALVFKTFDLKHK